MAAYSYRKLDVWQKAMGLAEETYRLSTFLPNTEKFALTDQMRRSAVSIPSNIAEGQKRPGKGEMIQFCGFALGSAAELETQLILAQKLYKLNVNYALRTCEEVSKMLTALIKALRSKNQDLRSKI
jgi:four helix bundle protein